MLILAGVSLNAIIGDNGIISNAQQASFKSGMAVLEEFLQEKYVELYEKTTNQVGTLAKLNVLRTAYPDYFYQPIDITGLDFVLYKGNMFFLIQKENLPEDIREQLRGGDAGDKSYTAYSSFMDVYGVTSDLKVYYCSDGLESLTGTSETLKDVGNRLAISNSSSFGNFLKTIVTIKSDENGNILAEGLSAFKTLNIENAAIANLDELYNLSSLETLYIKNSTITSLDGIHLAPLLKTIQITSSNIGDYTDIGNTSSVKTLKLVKLDNENYLRFCTNMANAKTNEIYYLTLDGVDTTKISNINQCSTNFKSGLKTLYINASQSESIVLDDNFTNLYEIKANSGWNQTIKSITLGNLPNLKYFSSLYSVVVTSFSIANCPKLETFWISGFRNVTNLTLPSTPELKVLKLAQNSGDSAYCLYNLTSVILSNVSKLEELNLWGLSALTSISGISSVSKLIKCDLGKTQLTDFSFLNDSQNLEELSVKETCIENINFLANNTKLKKLDISNTNFGKTKDSNEITSGGYEILAKNTTSNVLATVLSNNSELTNFNAENCDFFVYPSYLRLNTKITSLYLKGCDNIPASEIAVLKAALTSLSDYSLPDGKEIGFLSLTDTKFIIHDSTMTLTDFQSLSSYTTLVSLGLYNLKITDNATELPITGENSYDIVVNNVLKELTGLKYLAIRIENLTDISFVKFLPNIEYLDLTGTKVGTTTENGLKLLNTYCANIKTLGITSDITCNLSLITDAINKIDTISGNYGALGSDRIRGLYCASKSTWSSLSDCTSIRNFFVYLAKGYEIANYKSGINNYTFDLSGCTGLEKTYIEASSYEYPVTLNLPNTSTYALGDEETGYVYGFELNFQAGSYYDATWEPKIQGGLGCKKLSISFNGADGNDTWNNRFDSLLGTFRGSSYLRNFTILDNKSEFCSYERISFISTLSNLETFDYTGYATGKGMASIDFLKDLQNLKTLSLNQTNVSSLPRDMSNMKALTSISIKNSSLIDIDGFSTLTNKNLLTTVNFYNNSIIDVTELGELSELNWINLEFNKLETEKNTVLHGDVKNAKILNDLNNTYKTSHGKNIYLAVKENKFDDTGKALLSWAVTK